MLKGVQISQPIVQLIDFKEIPDSIGSKRVRLHISDGISATLVLLATDKTNMIASGELDKNCVIRVENYKHSTSDGK